MNPFSQLGLSEHACARIAKFGITTPSPIQQAAIPKLIQSSSPFIVQAATGTGKTAAFVLPLLEKLDTQNKCTQAIILAPTRELAKQVHKAIIDFSPKSIKVCLLMGGTSMRAQLQQLQRVCHIIIGTPGRICDHIQNKKSIQLDKITQFILDEADVMMDMGFTDDIEIIMKQTPKSKQLIWVSATIPAETQKLANQYMPDYQLIKTEAPKQSQPTTQQSYIITKAKQKYDTFKTLVSTTSDLYGVVFCRTKKDVDELKDRLKSDDIHVTAIHGDMPQQKRERNLLKLKNRKTDLLLATDVAARGIHIDLLTHVINYSLPDNLESYVHRIGRTGRAGQKGEAISFILPSQENKIHQIEKITQSKLTAHTLNNEVFVAPDKPKQRGRKVKPGHTSDQPRSKSNHRRSSQRPEHETKQSKPRDFYRRSKSHDQDSASGKPKKPWGTPNHRARENPRADSIQSKFKSSSRWDQQKFKHNAQSNRTTGTKAKQIKKIIVSDYKEPNSSKKTYSKRPKLTLNSKRAPSTTSTQKKNLRHTAKSSNIQFVEKEEV